MILFCPNCGTQHIDAPDKSGLTNWSNPPHKSHLCCVCMHIWRPADVATTGVTTIDTHGAGDSVPSVAHCSENARLLLVGMLRKCQTQFDFYAKSHREKNPPDVTKAAVNEQMAKDCGTAIVLAATGPEHRVAPAPDPDVADKFAALIASLRLNAEACGDAATAYWRNEQVELAVKNLHWSQAFKDAATLAASWAAKKNA